MSKKQFSAALTLLLLLVAFAPAFAQEAYLSVSGRVLDGETKAPLEYTAIGIRGKAIGTVSNTQGEFRFSFPAAYSGDTLFISHLGYKTFEAIVSTLTSEKTHTIQLVPQAIALEEIVVTNKELGPKEIVQAAVERIAGNYPDSPYIMDCFYREWSVRQAAGDTKQVPSLLEAAVSVADEGYKRERRAKLQEKVFIKELRRSALAEDAWNKLSRLLTQNFVKYNAAMGNYDVFPPVLQFPNQLEYKTLKTEVENGEYFYVIAVPLPGSPARYELYISYDDYSIARIDLKGDAEGGQPVSVSRRSSAWQLARVDNTVRFRRVNNKMYLSYLRSHWETRMVDPKTAKPLESNAFYSELLVSDIKTTNVEEETKRLASASMNPKVPLSAQRRPYNADFWKNYNIIKEAPLDKQVEEMLKATGELEEQFKESPQTRKKR